MSIQVNPQNFKFCPRCGGKLKESYVEQEHVARLVCAECGFIFYMNPTPAVAVILIRDGRVLLVKRKYEPGKGDWCLPAGFMEFNERAEETAVREVKEETNLDIKINQLYGVYPGFDDPRAHVVLIVFQGEILQGTAAPGDDAEEVEFFPLDELPTNVAFSSHRKVLRRLQQEIL